MKIYVIIINYNNFNYTLECVQSLLSSDFKDFRVIIVDNSENSSFFEIQNWLKKENAGYDVLKNSYIDNYKIKDSKVILIKSENNGFAAANNIGIKLALTDQDCKYLWVLNNDTPVKSDSLSKLIKKAEFYKNRGERVGIIGFLYCDRKDVINGVDGKYNKYLATSKQFGVFEKDIGQYDNEEAVKKMIMSLGLQCLY